MLNKKLIFIGIVLCIYAAQAWAQTGLTTPSRAAAVTEILYHPLIPRFEATPGSIRPAPPAAGKGDIGSVYLSAYNQFQWAVNPTVGNLSEPDLPVLSENQLAAVAAAPTWIQPALTRKFFEIANVGTVAEDLADLILNPEDELYRDEIAFAAAYMSLFDFQHCEDPLTLLADNARLIYEYDELLAYVELVEIADPGDGNYGTTARYTVLADDTHTQFEIPMEIYYWYVVHPRLSDENPDYIKPSTGHSEAPENGGLFWREYLLTDVTGEDSHATTMYMQDLDPADLQNLGPSARGYLTDLAIHNLELAYQSGTRNVVFTEFAYGSGTVYASTLRMAYTSDEKECPLFQNLLNQGNGDILLPEGAAIALIMDAAVPAFQTALENLGRWADTTIITSGDVAATDWSAFAKVVVASGQPLALYQAVADAKTALETYISGYKVLELHLDTDNANDPTGLIFPGGFTCTPQSANETDAIDIYGRPILLDLLDGIDVMWDGEVKPDISGDRDAWINADALEAIGNWVGKNMLDNIEERGTITGANPERSVQPTRIAWNHFGNCGELQDLINAAMRTGLIPGLSISDMNEDHVWNEFYHDGEWYYFQNDWSNGATRIATPGGGQDADYGGGKTISFILAWLGDGLVQSAIERYSNTVTLEVKLTDADGGPVPDATVEIYSEGWMSTSKYLGYWMQTDPEGKVSVQLGDGRNYYLRVLTAIGDYPAQPHKGGKAITLEQVIDAADAAPDSVFTFEHQFEGNLVKVEAQEPDNQNDAFALHVQLNATQRFGALTNPFSGATANPSIDPPALDVFLVDKNNLNDAQNNKKFTAAYAWLGVAALDELIYPPTDEKWFLLVNQHSAPSSDHLLDLTVTTEGDPWTPGDDDDDSGPDDDSGTDDDSGDDGGDDDDDDDDDNDDGCGC